MKKIIDVFKSVVYDETEDVFDTEFLTHYWRVWDFVGIWPRREGTKTFLSRLRYFYPRSLIALACFTISMPCFIHLYQNTGDILLVTEVICTIFLSLMMITKISTYTFQESKFKTIYSTIESLHVCQLNGNSYEISVAKKSIYFSRLVTKFIAPFLTLSVMVVGLPMMGVVAIKRIIPFQGWYPCRDTYASPCFEFILVFQTVIMTTHFHTIMISDTILVNVLVQTLAQFKILRHNLETIREYTESKIRTENESKAMHVFDNSLLQTTSGMERTARDVPINEHPRSGIHNFERKPELFTLSESVEKSFEHSHRGVQLNLVVIGAENECRTTNKEIRTPSCERIDKVLQVGNGMDRIRGYSSYGNNAPHLGDKNGPGIIHFERTETNSEHTNGAEIQQRRHFAWRNIREPIIRLSKCTRFSANKSTNARRSKVAESQFRSGIPRYEARKANAVKLWRREEEIKLKQIDQVMERRLAECVRHHQTLLSLVSKIESAYQPYFVIQLLCNAIPTSLCLYYFLVVPALSLKDSILIMSLSVTLGELLIFCFLADQISHISSRVKDSIYACDWLGASEGFKRSMRIIISRSNDPFVFRVMRFLPLSMPLYAEVTHIAYKQFMVMKKIGEK